MLCETKKLATTSLSLSLSLSLTHTHTQSILLDHRDSLTPGNYTLFAETNVGSYMHPFQMVSRSISQMVVAMHTDGALTFITVRTSVPVTSLPIMNIN